jgi:hypothetical protein
MYERDSSQMKRQAMAAAELREEEARLENAMNSPDKEGGTMM